MVRASRSRRSASIPPIAPPRRLWRCPIALVQQIVDATSQASWFQDVRDLSGDSDVTIPGFCTNCRIRTRASNYMFPLNNTGTRSATLSPRVPGDEGRGWLHRPYAVRESYTSANSGCTTRQGSQDLGEPRLHPARPVDYAQTQQVIFLVHYDTSRRAPPTTPTNSEGADDAISGGSALLERCGCSTATPGSSR